MKRSKWIGLGILFLFLFVAASGSYAKGHHFKRFLPDIPKNWTQLFPDDLYPDFEYEGLKPGCAACPGFDPEFSFFVKGGKVNKLVVYFQGGGACWDSMNCLYAHTYSEEVPPLEAFEDTEGAGIFDTNNPKNPFKNWYFVYIPYCTGDVHWGANDHKYDDYLNQFGGGTVTIHHRGFVNFQVVLKWIHENFRAPRKIFVTGSSAGGYGAILAFPYIKQAYPWSRVYVLGDAANGVVSESFEEGGIYNWNVQVPTWIPGFEDFHGQTLAEMYIAFAHRYPLSKLAQFTTAWDATQTYFYNVMLNIDDYKKWGDDFWPLVWCDWHNQMLDLVYTTAGNARNYRYYVAAGNYHTILMSPDFYEEDSAGVPFRKWVRAMVKNPFGMWGGPLGGRWKNVECEECEDPFPCSGTDGTQ